MVKPYPRKIATCSQPGGPVALPRWHLPALRPEREINRHSGNYSSPNEGGTRLLAALTGRAASKIKHRNTDRFCLFDFYFLSFFVCLFVCFSAWFAGTWFVCLFAGLLACLLAWTVHWLVGWVVV